MSDTRLWAKIEAAPTAAGLPPRVLCAEPLEAATLRDAEIEARSLLSAPCCKGADRVVLANELGDDLKVVFSRPSEPANQPLPRARLAGRR